MRHQHSYPAQDLEPIAVDVWRDAGILQCAQPEDLAANRELIEEARERLNDALAKADRALRVAA